MLLKAISAFARLLADVERPVVIRRPERRFALARRGPPAVVR